MTFSPWRHWVARAEQARAMDAATITEVGIPGRVLMELAGAGTTRLMLERVGNRVGKAVVLCGSGNNGGDGYVIARHLLDAGWRVHCVALSDLEALNGDARANAEIYLALGGEQRLLGQKVTARLRHLLGHADLIVDALFGTGLSRAVQGGVAELIAVANGARHGLRVAVDLPSGIGSDTGQVLGTAFEADLTVTFGVAKPGLYLHPGATCAGEVQVLPIAFPRSVVQDVGAVARLADAGTVAGLIPPRPSAAHKGSFGHVGVVGGRRGKQGAGVLAALGALRAGAGLVTWNLEGPPGEIARPPEIMCHDASCGLESRANVLVVGPGLGLDHDAERLLEASCRAGTPVVFDADALTMLAEGRLADVARSCDGVMTPHPAEAGRLLGCTTSEVQSDRLKAAKALCDAWGHTIVLKGACTLIASVDSPIIMITSGDPTLAAGGTGDVLAGVIGALMAQGLSAHDAAVVAAFVHGCAGVRAGQRGDRRGALASEIADTVPAILGELVAGWQP